MTFKEARKQAREIAIRKNHWVYIYKDNSKKNSYYISENYDFSANLTTSYYVHKSGRILNIAIYKEIDKDFKKRGMHTYPFSPIIMNYLEDKR